VIILLARNVPYAPLREPARAAAQGGAGMRLAMSYS
jgi:hypothetical protein